MLPINQVVGVVGPLTLGTKIKFESMRGRRCVDPFADVVGYHCIIYKESDNLRKKVATSAGAGTADGLVLPSGEAVRRYCLAISFMLNSTEPPGGILTFVS